MRRVLLDQGVPRGVRSVLSGFTVSSAFEMAWHELTNGQLLAAAEKAGFDVVVTCDRNIRHQQSLSGRTLALVVLETNHWPTIRKDTGAVRQAVVRVQASELVSVPFERPTLRRRPPLS